MIQGVGGLVRNVGGGGIGAVGKITGSLSNGLTGLTFDSEFQKKR